MIYFDLGRYDVVKDVDVIITATADYTDLDHEVKLLKRVESALEKVPEKKTVCMLITNVSIKLT